MLPAKRKFLAQAGELSVAVLELELLLLLSLLLLLPAPNPRPDDDDELVLTVFVVDFLLFRIIDKGSTTRKGLAVVEGV